MREEELTTQDIDLIKLFALPDKDIAERTKYTISTVRTYKNRIYRRINAINNTHALFKAVKAGIIRIEEIVTE